MIDKSMYKIQTCNPTKKILGSQVLIISNIEYKETMFSNGEVINSVNVDYSYNFETINVIIDRETNKSSVS